MATAPTRMTMLLLRKPSPETIQDFLAAQAKLDLTYPTVGATAAVPPPGYVVDHTRIKLGEGEVVFRAAKVALFDSLRRTQTNGRQVQGSQPGQASLRGEAWHTSRVNHPDARHKPHDKHQAEDNSQIAMRQNQQFA